MVNKLTTMPAAGNGVIGTNLGWVQFSKADFETSVRDFEGTLIGFKIYLDIRVNVEGRGHTFQQTLHVDPKDKFEQTMR
jgi:hypothetical protein